MAKLPNFQDLLAFAIAEQEAELIIKGVPDGTDTTIEFPQPVVLHIAGRRFEWKSIGGKVG